MGRARLSTGQPDLFGESGKIERRAFSWRLPHAGRRSCGRHLPTRGSALKRGNPGWRSVSVRNLPSLHYTGKKKGEDAR